MLQFVKLPVGQLDLDLAEQQVADDRFWEVVAAIGEDRNPDWVSHRIAESAGRLLSALTVAAPRVAFSTPTHKTIEIRSSAVHVETWSPSTVQRVGLAQVHGRLKKVDLRSHEFRVRDDVDFSVDLKHVIDDVGAGRLVGRWVMAEGEATVNAEGRVVVLDDARVYEIADPGATFVGRYVVSIDEVLESAPGPDPDGGIDLTEEEVAEFLRAARS